MAKKAASAVTKKNVSPPIGRRYFEVRESIFDRSVHVFLNWSYADYEQWVKEKGGLRPEGTSDFNAANFSAFSSQLEVAGKPREWTIVMPSFDWKIDDMGTLVHEITHTIIKIFAMNNISFCFETQEFSATNVGNLFRDISAKIHFAKKLTKKQQKESENKRYERGKS